MRPGIAIIGAGGIVRSAHLPAYRAAGFPVIGIYDPSPEAVALARDVWPDLPAYESLEQALADPLVSVIDAATHPAPRAGIIEDALKAGKHVLSQKPFALDLATADRLIALAKEQNRWLAVNQNGRFSPPWAAATRAIQAGEIGRVRGVTHLFDTDFGWIEGTVFDSVPHWLIYDYAVHWIDIIRVWMGDAQPAWVRAEEFRTWAQPAGMKATAGLTLEFGYANGDRGLIRSGGRRGPLGGHPFWIDGETGNIRGSVLGRDSLYVNEKELALTGKWFNDAFSASMQELLDAIDENRVPSHHAVHNRLSLAMTLAACQSAELAGQRVDFGD
jgi:predicted dehydrogenase